MIHRLADAAGHTSRTESAPRWSASDGAAWLRYQIDGVAWIDAAGDAASDGFASCNGGNLDAGGRVRGMAGSFLAVGLYRGAWTPAGGSQTATSPPAT